MGESRPWKNGADSQYQLQGSLLLTWFNFNTIYNVWDEITYPFLNFNGTTVGV